MRIVFAKYMLKETFLNTRWYWSVIHFTEKLLRHKMFEL